MTYQELVKDHSGKMIEQLIAWVIEEDPFEIQFDFLDSDQWALITMHQYEEDKEISLRLHLNDYYDMYFGYYDDEDEFFEIIHPLTEEEKEIIPQALRKLMKKVLDDEKGLRITGKFLSR